MNRRWNYLVALALAVGMAGPVWGASKAEQAQQSDKSDKSGQSSSDRKSDKAKSDTKADEAASTLPKGFRGFDGTLGGPVVSIDDNGDSFVMHVKHILATSPNSKAGNPQVIVGQDVTIYPGLNKKDGKEFENEREKAWFKSLKKGEDIPVDCKTIGGKLRVNQMTTGERGSANKELKKEEKKKD